MRGIDRRAGAWLAATLSVGALIVPTSADASPAPVTITATDGFAFSPGKVEIPKDSAVRWSWDGAVSHNITFRTIDRHSETTTAGHYQHRFKRAGVYRYYCSIHGFQGRVVVGG